MNLSDEIRKQIEKNKGLKLAVGEINNHLSILENFVRKDIMEQVDEAYQKGLKDGKEAFDLLDAERDSEYQRGLNDAWEAARKIAQQWEEDTDTEHRLVIDDSISITLDSMTASEAIEKLKAYEEQKATDELKVGDEVKWKGDRFIVTRICQPLIDKLCDGLGEDGHPYLSIAINRLTKTGRHFDIDKILEAMKE